MLSVSRFSPLRSQTPSKRDHVDAPSMSPAAEELCADFDFDFDFTELLAGFGGAVDVLPDLEMDTSEILVDFPAGAEESILDETAAMEAEVMPVEAADSHRDEVSQAVPSEVAAEREDKVSSEEEVFSASMKEEASTAASASEVNSLPPVMEKGRKPSVARAKSSQSQGKRKVDWTPELHRRFVEAVEQLGVEKAVPSRILELMGNDRLTRHNVASHLQKYRSHLKHMMSRKTEAASWCRRQMYAAAVPATASGAAGAKGENISPWLQTPTMGFPPPGHHHPHMQTLRPLHVWGHPTVDQSLVPIWPKHLFPAQPALVPSPPWMAPYATPLHGPPPPPHGTPWSPHFATVALTQGTPYFPQPLPTMRFSAPVPGIPPHPMYQQDGVFPFASPPPPPSPCKPPSWLKQLDDHPSKESIDAAIGDVLAQPWLPLPLALKPPSLESVLVELQKQGVSNIPPCN